MLYWLQGFDHFLFHELGVFIYWLDSIGAKMAASFQPLYFCQCLGWSGLNFLKLLVSVIRTTTTTHMWHPFLFPISYKCPDLNFAPYVLCIFQIQSLGNLGSYESWRQSLVYILSLDQNFVPFLATTNCHQPSRRPPKWWLTCPWGMTMYCPLGPYVQASFCKVAQYSKPQPYLMPGVVGALQEIGKWSYIVILDLLKLFYQISLAHSSMK